MVYKLAFLILSACIIFSSGCKKNDQPTDPVDQEQSQNLPGKILYESVGDGIHIFDSQTLTDRKLMDGSYPEILINGKIVHVLDYPNRLMISNQYGEPAVTLAENNRMYFKWPRASSDGKYIAVTNVLTSTTFGFNKGTIVYDINGTKAVSLDGYFHPTWTPDGRLVLSGSYYDFMGPQADIREGIYITDKYFNNPQRIDPDLPAPMMPSVSPDGKQVAFVSGDHIWIMNIDGTSLRQLTKSESFEIYPEWTADGKYILLNYYANGAYMAIVPSGATTTITGETKCFISTKDKYKLNSSSQICSY